MIVVNYENLTLLKHVLQMRVIGHELGGLVSLLLIRLRVLEIIFGKEEGSVTLFHHMRVHERPQVVFKRVIPCFHLLIFLSLIHNI